MKKFLGLLACLLVLSSQVSAKTVYTHLEERVPKRAYISIDTCVLVKDVEYKKGDRLGLYNVVMQCRDFEDPDNMVYTWTSHVLDTKDLEEDRKRPGLKAGSVWDVRLHAGVAQVGKNEYKVLYTQLTPSIYTESSYRMPLAELEKFANRKISQGPLIDARDVHNAHIKAGGTFDTPTFWYEGGRPKNLRGTSVAEEEKKNRLPEGKRKATLNDVLESYKGKSVDELKKIFGEPMYELTGKELIDIMWEKIGGAQDVGGKRSSCYVHFYFDKKTKKAVEWYQLICDEKGNFGYLPEDTFIPQGKLITVTQ